MSILNHKQKVTFDPSEPEHRTRAINMIQTNSWGAGGCPFKITAPYTNIVDEIKDKIIKQVIADGWGQ